MYKGNFNEKTLRVISGLAIVLITLFAINTGFFLFFLISLLIGMVFEWVKICANSKKDILIGVILISVSVLSLFLIKHFNFGKELLVWYFVVIWSYDSFALIGGRIILGKKLAEKISPQKTWSGFFVGLSSAIILTSILELFLPHDIFLYKIFSFGRVIPVVILVILAQLGDLLESYFKRKYSIKDSGAIIPGHGGVLDRYDSILLSAPIFLILLVL